MLMYLQPYLKAYAWRPATGQGGRKKLFFCGSVHVEAMLKAML